MSNELIAGLFWGAGLTAIFSTAIILSYREWILEKLSNPGPGVSIHETTEGKMVAVIIFDDLWI